MEWSILIHLSASRRHTLRRCAINIYFIFLYCVFIALRAFNDWCHFHRHFFFVGNFQSELTIYRLKLQPISDDVWSTRGTKINRTATASIREGKNARKLNECNLADTTTESKCLQLQWQLSALQESEKKNTPTTVTTATTATTMNNNELKCM